MPALCQVLYEDGQDNTSGSCGANAVWQRLLFRKREGLSLIP